jgi:NADH:ubiquinone reductase (H+-translocating)
MPARLEPGSRVAIAGGGPAGSLFALHLLHQARLVGLPLQVTLYEPRRFPDPGASGCNMCAGILSSRLLRDLARLDLRVPDEVVMSRIGGYSLHTRCGTVEVDQPHPLEAILAVYRGGGPGGRGDRSFDEFLLGAAVDRGVERIAEAVEDVYLGRPRPRLKVAGEEVEVDLLVLATGVNSSLTTRLPHPYDPPPTERMVQVELVAGVDPVAESLGGRVHVFLLPGGRMHFGTLIPKGAHINVSVLGRGADPMRVEEFLEQPLVRRLLPEGARADCRCRPRIAVGAARHPFAERVVAVGDAAVSRLYKDGIGAASVTSGRAATTAIRHGVGAAEFARHYHPLQSQLARDNRRGRLLLGLNRRMKDSRAFFGLQSHVLAQERSAPYPARLMDRINWGMFTGAYTYSQILGMALSPRLWWSFARAALRPWEGSMATDGPAAPAAPRRRTRVLVLGGGFAGVNTMKRLERTLGRDPGVALSLVSDENFFLFTPMLHEVVSGGIETRHIAVPIRRLRGDRRFDFVRASVQSVDLNARRVHTTRGPLDYDALVVALGSTTDMRAIEGREEHVFELKTLAHAVRLRNQIIRVFEAAAAGEPDGDALLTFVVVGGGITGVQTAADVNEQARRFLPREYTSIHPWRVRVLLLHEGADLVPELHPRLRRAARETLEKQGVEVRLRTRVSDVDEGTVELEGGTRIRARTVIWTPGIVANPVVAAMRAPHDDIGRVHVDAHYRLAEHPEVFVLGDAAHQLDPATGEPLMPTAHIAVRQPGAVAHNVQALLRGTPMRTWRYHHMGQMVALGPRAALAEVFGIKLRGFATRLLWQSAYSALMAGGPYNKARVATGWALGLLFGRDSTLLRGHRR